MTRPRHRASLVAVAFVAVYVGTWLFRHELGFIHPAANARYFYYGADPCTFSDSLVYWAFSPAYKTSLAIQRSRTGGYADEIHWSDRDGGFGYEHLCKHGRRLGV